MMYASRDLGPGTNPLRRGSDRVQAAARLTCELLFLLGCVIAVLVGARTYEAQRAKEEADARDGYHVTGQVAARTPWTNAESGMIHWTIQVAWQDRQGNERRQHLAVTGPEGHQRTMRMWVDADGDAVPEPRATTHGPTEAIGAGLVTMLAAATVLAGAYVLIVALLNRRRYLEWERDWSRVEPGWRREIL